MNHAELNVLHFQAGPALHAHCLHCPGSDTRRPVSDMQPAAMRMLGYATASSVYIHQQKPIWACLRTTPNQIPILAESPVLSCYQPQSQNGPPYQQASIKLVLCQKPTDMKQSGSFHTPGSVSTVSTRVGTPNGTSPRIFKATKGCWRYLGVLGHGQNIFWGLRFIGKRVFQWENSTHQTKTIFQTQAIFLKDGGRKGGGVKAKKQ